MHCRKTRLSRLDKRSPGQAVHLKAIPLKSIRCGDAPDKRLFVVCGFSPLEFTHVYFHALQDYDQTEPGTTATADHEVCESDLQEEGWEEVSGFFHGQSYIICFDLLHVPS